MTKPFFSVVVPTLNEADFVLRLLEDLTRQTEHGFEVILVDGKSTDGTVVKAQTFASKIPLTILTSQKKNVGWQRNLGAEAAKGQYVVFFDADVQITPRFLKLLRRQIERTKPPFVTTYLRADSTIVNDRIIASLFNLSIEASLFVERPFVPGFNFIVRRDVLAKAGGFNSRIKHGEDHELATRLYEAGYPLTILKTPRLIFSLRRYRTEGRLAVLRKNALATWHVFTKGHITQEIFEYPMGGGWYKTVKRESVKPQVLPKVRRFVKKLVRLLLE